MFPKHQNQIHQIKNNNNMKVIIEKRHCEQSSGYSSNDNCPLCVAIKEQHPTSNLFHAGGDYVRNYDRTVKLKFNAHSDNGWNCLRVLELNNNEIDKYVLYIPYPEYDKKMQEGNAPDTNVATIKVPEHKDITSELAVLPINETSDLIVTNNTVLS